MVELKVSVEASLNSALSSFFNEFYEKYGVCVTNVRVDWNNFSTIGEKRYVAREISIEMTSDVQ